MYQDSIPLLEVKDLNFWYSNPSKPILDNVNLSIYQGDRIGIIGGNGSGKSTLTKLLLGIYRPKIGTISMFGKVVSWGEHFPNIGYIGDPGHNAQELGLPTGYTIQQVIDTLCALYNSQEVTSQSELLLSNLGLSDMKSRRIANLSTGERKRLMVCLTFLRMPDFIILDEPFDGLDESIVVYIKSVLSDALQNQALTIFFISHSKIEIDTFTKKVYRLKEGELFFEPQHFFSGELIIDSNSAIQFHENTGQVMGRMFKILESAKKNNRIALRLESSNAVIHE
ncbi:MAG TPA: ATP-binding cassette domain-containing protein [Saprospiraceae bacterium]|nr:ATP-binding cassette domain-containing protein [Saprospiraceae bacterium]HMP23735.1 ATP-binding cassette domain-containing protein [Saprospiraceae bacterium]